MIDIDKIEAAAKAAPYEAPWRYEPTGQTVWAGNVYMVADIRGWGHLQYMLNGERLQDATGVYIATANPATVLEMVSMIRERDVNVVELRCQVMTLATQVADLQMKAIERDAVLPPPFRKQGQQMTYDGYDKAPCDLYAKEQMQEAVDQITQIQDQNTYLDKVASNLQDLCDKQAKMLADRDAVLRQALEALERTETHLRIEVNEAYGRDAHVSTITEWQGKLAHHKGTIAAIKGVLEP